MAGSLNKVMLIGNLGADPEVNQTPNGALVAKFRIACTESWKDKNTGEKHERTEWVTIIAWRNLAEIVEKHFRKGMKIYVEGKLQTRSWEDKNGGGKRYATEVLMDNFIFCDGAPSGGHGGGSGRPNIPKASTDGLPDFGDTVPGEPGPGPSDDDLPFN